MDERLEIFSYRIGSADKMRTHIVSHTAGYGLVSNQHTTNGDWYEALDYALTELDPAYIQHPGHSVAPLLDSTGVPEELLRLADGWAAAPMPERRRRFDQAKPCVNAILSEKIGNSVREEVLALFPESDVGAVFNDSITVLGPERMYIRWWRDPLQYSVQINVLPVGEGARSLLIALRKAYQREYHALLRKVGEADCALAAAKAAADVYYYKLTGP